MIGLSPFDLFYNKVTHLPCVITQDKIKEVVFTGCNGGVEQGEKINRLAQKVFHERFRECIIEDTFNPEKFSEIFPDDELPYDSFDGFHMFDKAQLLKWLEQSPKCPICKDIIEQILPCPYLTQKFGERSKDALRTLPEIQKLSGDHVINMDPSSFFRDPNELLKLFLLEMAYFELQGQNPLDASFDPNEGLIAWCLLHDKDEANILLEWLRQDFALSKVHINVLKKHPMLQVFKGSIDVCLESIGPIPESEQMLGRQMQYFITAFVGDHTNQLLFDRLWEELNVSLNYTLADLVMIPPDKKRCISPHIRWDEIQKQEESDRIKRAIVGLIATSITLYFVSRRIVAFFRSSKSIPEN